MERKIPPFALFLGYLFRMLLRLLLLTCKFSVKGGESLYTSQKVSRIIMMFHNRLVLIGPSILKTVPKTTFCAFISNSKDGDIAAAYTTSYKMGKTVRVPHDSREKALKTLISRLKLKKDIAIITPDGPRGPIYEIKPGVAIAARETEALVIPFSWKCSSYFELNSWDKMRIPKPFSRIEATFGTPISLPKDGTIEEDLKILKQALHLLD